MGVHPSLLSLVLLRFNFFSALHPTAGSVKEVLASLWLILKIYLHIYIDTYTYIHIHVSLCSTLHVQIC